MPPLPRRRFLLATTAIASSAGAYALGIEPRWLEVSIHSVEIKGLPLQLHGLVVAQISDLHFTRWTSLHDTLFQSLRTHTPDLILITGDLVDSEKHLVQCQSLLTRLSSFGKHRLAVHGNWEHWGQIPDARLHDAFASCGIRLLRNETVVLPGNVQIVAIDDACSGYAMPSIAMRRYKPASLNLLMTHSPSVLDEINPPSVPLHLALAGHTHGGQLTLSGNLAVTPPGSGRFVSGFYDTPIGPAYVCRGLGTSVVPARLFCRPELALFRFLRA